jgi:cytochrome c553
MKKFLLTLTFVSLGLGAQQAAAIQKGDAARGKELSATCVACHGPDGNSPSPAFPRIGGQYADYLFKAMKDYKIGQRDNAIMKGIVAGLSEQQMYDLAAFFAQQKGQLVQTGLGE